MQDRPTLLEFVRRLSHDRSVRIALSGWLTPGHEKLRRFLYAGHRSMGSEPATREALGPLFDRLGGSVSTFFYGPAAFLPIDAVLGGPSPHPTQSYWRAQWLRVARLVRQRVGLPRRLSMREEELAAWRAGAVRTTAEEVSVQRADRAVVFAYRAAATPPWPEGMVQVHEALGARLTALPPLFRGAGDLELARTLLAEGGLAALGEVTRGRVRAGLEEYAGLADTDPADAEEARALAGRLGS